MNEMKLPESYRGFSTAELLVLWNMIPGGKLSGVNIPMEKIEAMRLLLLEYKINSLQKDGIMGMEPLSRVDQQGMK